jgi:hypothetical protein
MNANTSASTSSASAASRNERDGARRTDPHTLRREGDRFERLLRDKSGRCDDDDAMLPFVPAPECALPAAAPTSTGPAQTAPVAAAVPRAGAAAADTPSATQAALGSAMSAQAPQPVAVQGSDAQAFQVSIHEPMGLPLELRAVRVAAAGPAQAPAHWALNIAVPAREAAQLGRHGARLDERLRARGVDGVRVRIHHDEGHDEQPD